MNRDAGEGGRNGQGRGARGNGSELEEVARYWNTHLNATQFLGDRAIEEGSPEFFDAIEASFNRFQYKGPLFDWIASRPGRTLLEIGCGLGNDLAELARRGLVVTGIDLAPRVAELARNHLALRGLPGSVQVANCERLHFSDHSFDIVYSSGVIQHTPDIQAAVREIFRVLRPGGIFVIVLYHRHSWFNLISKLSRTNVEFADADAPIIRTFSRRELQRLFAGAVNLRITMEHYRPSATSRRGKLAFLFNRLFVPCYGRLPRAIIRPFGWHAVVTGRLLRTPIASGS